jgi:hypothetical protein
MMDDDWPKEMAWMAERCRPFGISWKQYLAYQAMETAQREKWTEHQRGEFERDQRDPKAQTWGLALLYPAAAFIIWIGSSHPSYRVCATAQQILVIIGGVWIAWVSARLLIRENHRYRIWVHYALGVLGFVGCCVVLFGFTHFLTERAM